MLLKIFKEVRISKLLKKIPQNRKILNLDKPLVILYPFLMPLNLSTQRKRKSSKQKNKNRSFRLLARSRTMSETLRTRRTARSSVIILDSSKSSSILRTDSNS